MINSNQLGAKGESRFQELCADAGLICNSSQRDLAGWDFLVDFPTQLPWTDTLDQRPAPLSSYFQIKTMWEGNNRFQLRLSSAERLAKEIKPTFIYVFSVARNLTISQTWLIHVHGQFLADILQRLRCAQRDGAVAINKKYIQVDVRRWAKSVETSGPGLRAAIEASCPAFLTYIEEKRRHLEEVGFSKNRIRMETTVVAQDIETLVDGFLGLTELETSSLEVFERRFDIELPLPPNLKGKFKGKLKISPSAVEEVLVRIRSGLLKPALFHGRLFSPGIPGLPEEHQRLIVRTNTFDFTFRRGSICLSSNVEWGERKALTLEEWRNFFHAACLLAQGEATLELVAPGKPPLIGVISADNPVPFSGRAKRSHELVEKTGAILALAGVESGPIAFSDLARMEDQLLLAYARLNGMGDATTGYHLNPDQDVPFPAKFDLIVVNPLPIGEHSIVYVTRVCMERTEADGSPVWVSSAYTVKSIHCLQNFTDDYERFLEQERAAAPGGNLAFWPIVETEPA